MNPILWIVLFTLIGGFLSVLAASLFLLIPTRLQGQVLPHCVSFALGALLGVALLDLMPEAISQVGIDGRHRLFATVLCGILLFFVLEKLLLWRHCHTGDCATHSESHFHQPAGALIVLGDTLHNFVDGILITAAFMTDINLGIMTGLAVFAHEIPQEVGDFAILLQSGYSRGKALLYNLVSSLATLLGGLLAYGLLDALQEALPYILALAASSFIYVAIADLIPSLHQRTTALAAVQQVSLIVVGIAVVTGLR